MPMWSRSRSRAAEKRSASPLPKPISSTRLASRPNTASKSRGSPVKSSPKRGHRSSNARCWAGVNRPCRSTKLRTRRRPSSTVNGFGGALLPSLENGSVIAPRPEWPGRPRPPSSGSSSSPQGGPWPAIARGLGVLARGGGSRPALRMRELSPDQSFHRARGAGVALARDAPGAERRAAGFARTLHRVGHQYRVPGAGAGGIHKYDVAAQFHRDRRIRGGAAAALDDTRPFRAPADLDHVPLVFFPPAP